MTLKMHTKLPLYLNQAQIDLFQFDITDGTKVIILIHHSEQKLLELLLSFFEGCQLPLWLHLSLILLCFCDFDVSIIVLQNMHRSILCDNPATHYRMCRAALGCYRQHLMVGWWWAGELLSISRIDGKERQAGSVAAVPGESGAVCQKTALKNNLYRNSF